METPSPDNKEEFPDSILDRLDLHSVSPTFPASALAQYPTSQPSSVGNLSGAPSSMLFAEERYVHYEHNQNFQYDHTFSSR